MSKKNDYTPESSIRYHETNLVRLIQQRNDVEERAANGDNIAPSYLERLEGTIKQVEQVIHNWRTKGRGYD